MLLYIFRLPWNAVSLSNFFFFFKLNYFCLYIIQNDCLEKGQFMYIFVFCKLLCRTPVTTTHILLPPSQCACVHWILSSHHLFSTKAFFFCLQFSIFKFLLLSSVVSLVCLWINDNLKFYTKFHWIEIHAIILMVAKKQVLFVLSSSLKISLEWIFY